MGKGKWELAQGAGQEGRKAGPPREGLDESRGEGSLRGMCGGLTYLGLRTSEPMVSGRSGATRREMRGALEDTQAEVSARGWPEQAWKPSTLSRAGIQCPLWCRRQALDGEPPGGGIPKLPAQLSTEAVPGAVIPAHAGGAEKPGFF